MVEGAPAGWRAEALMKESDHILSRIREALTPRSPRPGMHDGLGPGMAALPALADHGRVLPAVGESFADRLARFAENAADLRADFKLLDDLNALRAELKRLRDAEGWVRVASHKGRLTDVACEALGRPVLLTDSPFDKHDLDQCEVGITECDALVSQTGSVVITSRSSGGRALSILPPHHVVLACRDQLVAGLPEAFALLKEKYAARYPSMVSFITGPSRTGDIERILVLGAHGPKRLTILCV